jgi:mannose/fructose/N-acetylgalactosamine-specific phosphotransferase system component IID
MGFILATGILLVLKCIGYQSLASFSFDEVSFKVLVLVAATYVFYYLLRHKKMGTVPLILVSAVWGILVSYSANLA